MSKLKEILRRSVSIPLRRWLGGLLIEAGMGILKIKDHSVPPITLDYVGGFDFKAIGNEFLRYFVEFGGMKRNHAVLDIGSGIGRMAIPMTNYLKHGRYEGIEIVPKGVDWCRHNITVKHPNFTFTHADIYNKSYNKNGTIKASEYRFPFENGTFDFVFLTSVFTHMLTKDVENYIGEISRVLKPGGKVLSTWFLLDGNVRQLMAQHPESLQIVHAVPGSEHVFTANPFSPEDATGYESEFVVSTFRKNGLEPDGPMNSGSWCGRDDFTSVQDILVCRKK